MAREPMTAVVAALLVAISAAVILLVLRPGGPRTMRRSARASIVSGTERI